MAVETTLVAIFGRKGQGKSTLLRHFVYTQASEGYRFVVYDSTREWWPAPGVEVCSSLHWSIDEACEHAIEARERSVLVVDEIHKYAPNHAGGLKTGTPLQRIVAEGRHLETGLLCASQRVARVHTDVGYLADEIYLFRHTGPRDLQWIADVCGEDWAERCRALKDHEFLRVQL